MDWRKRGFSSAAHPGYRLHYVRSTRNQGVYASFDVGWDGKIFMSDWKTREMGGVVMKLDARDQEV